MIHFEKYPDYSISFDDPKIGNSISVSLDISHYKTMSGDLYIYTSLNSFETHKITIDYLSENELNDLISFINNTTGYEIFFKNHNNDIYKGVILNTTIDTVTSNRCEFLSVNLIFKGLNITKYLETQDENLLLTEDCKILKLQDQEYKNKFLLLQDGTPLALQLDTQILKLEK